MLARALVPLALFLVVPLNQSLVSNSSDGHTNDFLGNVQDGWTTYSVIKLSDGSVSSIGVEQQSAPTNSQQLVWIYERPVDPSINYHIRDRVQGESFDHFLDTLTTYRSNPEFPNGQEQSILTNPQYNTPASFSTQGYGLHYRTKTAALLSVSLNVAQTFDSLLPPHWKYVFISSTPVPYPDSSRPSTKHVQVCLSDLKFNSLVASVITNISVAEMKNDIEHLTGEDGKSNLISRNSLSDGARVAAHWLKERFEETGLTCNLHQYLPEYSPNVVW